MFTDVTAAVSAVASMGLSRRSLMAIALLTLPFDRLALAATTLGDPTATIRDFNQALLATMKSGGQSSFSQRFQALAPAIDQAFDLQNVLSLSVGLGWANLPSDQQTRLLEAFRRYTVASYVANFDHYAGQSFTVSPDTQSLGADRVLVKSRIVPANGDPTDLDYVMQQTSSGWKIVDVLAAGSISRVAVQRSDFRHLLSKGGGEALFVSLQRKTSDLSGGALA
jgi:phospholipid transport system substrate-binding protein